MNLTHRNRFSQFTLCLGEFRSAAVPPPQRGGLWAHPPCSMIRKKFQYISILYNKPKRAAKRALPAGEGDRGVSLRTGGGGGSHFTAPSSKRITDTFFR